MTLRRARFFGGLLDGQTREVAPGRRYLHLASCEVDRYVTETYVRDGYSGSEPDSEPDIVLHYRFESSEDGVEQSAMRLTDFIRRLIFADMSYVTFCELHEHVDELRRLVLKRWSESEWTP